MFFKNKDLEDALLGIQEQVEELCKGLDRLEKAFREEEKDLKNALKLLSEPLDKKENKCYLVSVKEVEGEENGD